MPVYDTQRKCLVLRIVYDGFAFAGKTTNLSQLVKLLPAQKRTEMYTPGALRGRTMFFDWLEIEGGKVGGQSLKCQLLTVPGQGLRSYRRRPLLFSADAVVFVCDSAEDQFYSSKKAFSQLKAVLRKRHPARVPIIVQANKRDAPNALPLEQISKSLRLPSDISLLPASAAGSEGVKETLLQAIRLSVRELQRRIAEVGIVAIAGAPQTADDLFDKMLELEENLEEEPGELEVSPEDEFELAQEAEISLD